MASEGNKAQFLRTIERVSHRRSFSAGLFLPALVLLILLPSFNASAWWSTGAIESVHEKISNKAFDLVLGRLVEKPFLATYRNAIVGYTTTASNDTNAHGGNSARNGGPIVQWFDAFRAAYNDNRLNEAAEYLGYSLHLIEDMHVPAHAFNIPHYQVSNPFDFDNFEFMADEVLNKLGVISLQDTAISETDGPKDLTVYYWRAIDATKARVALGFSEYWHAGSGHDWNGDGPQGYYHDQTTNEDIFPKLYGNMSKQEKDFLTAQLSEAVRYVGMFLLSVDRSAIDPLSVIFDTVQKLYIGYYQRPADPGGLVFWANALASVDSNHDGSLEGENLMWVLEQFAFSDEARTLYGGDITSSNISTVIDSIYLGLFGRKPDDGGKAFWVNSFNTGASTPASILWEVVKGAQFTDRDTLSNKLTTAERFTATIDPNLDGAPPFQATWSGPDDLLAARIWLAAVTSDPSTVPTMDQVTDFIVFNIADPGIPLSNTNFLR
jgi:hypothetical protein